MPAHQPDSLSTADGLAVVRRIAERTENIIDTMHSQARGRQRTITRRQMELCCQRGTVTEGPFVNSHGNWQMNLCRHAAGEEITCVVAIEWDTKILIVTAFHGGG
jgi:hypothetical protein